MITTSAVQQVEDELVRQYGKTLRQRASIGVRQVAQSWREEDGDPTAFSAFCQGYFIADEQILEQNFTRIEKNFESLLGNLHRVYRDFNWMLHVDAGEMVPVDQLFANYDVFSHVQDDLFKSRIAFVLLLNFPIPELVDKNVHGPDWSRARWAQTRRVEQFADRIPAAVRQARSTAYTTVEEYIYTYNIFIQRLVDEDGRRPFSQNKKLISHWGLRDELKAQYAEPDGMSRQRLLATVMERIIRQEIPQAVVNSEAVEWSPQSNTVFHPETGAALSATAEGTTRYEALLKIFHAERAQDRYTPATPSLIDRRFQVDREILEADTEQLLVDVLTAPVLKDMADLIRRRLSRELQPFDIWYPGFKSGQGISETDLDKAVSRRFPNLAAFQESLPEVLRQLGFSEARAGYLGKFIRVDAARGAGHAMGARMRYDNAHLRTRVPEGGMDYKGFNTAMHELGHTVEQVFSMNDVDYYALEGVPNTAFTEAFAFVFQARDLDVLGLGSHDAGAIAGGHLADMWQTMEIAGVSLLDMRIWRWLYAHPEATAQELKEGVIGLAGAIWNEYFAPVLGCKDSVLLAIYSHLIYCGMYTPDYAIGHIIAHQIEEFLARHELAGEMERMCRLGRLTPQVWMQKAVGSDVSARPLIAAATSALSLFEAGR